MDSEKTARLTHHYIQQRLKSNEPPADASTLKLLLQNTPAQNRHPNTNLSPTGTFKYIQDTFRNKSHYSKSSSTSQRIRRPLNCFMVFSHLERKRVAEEYPELHNADLSKILGQKWKGLTPSQRQPYINEAERIRQLHTEIYPHYKYQPRRKSSGSKKNQGKLPETSGSDDSGKSSPASTPANSPLQSCSPKTSTPYSTSDIQPNNNTKVETYSWPNTPNLNQQYPYEIPQAQIDQSSSYMNYPYQYENQFNFSSVNQNHTYDTARSFPPTPEVSPSLPNHHAQMFSFPNQIEQPVNPTTFSHSFTFSSPSTTHQIHNNNTRLSSNFQSTLEAVEGPMPLVKSPSFKNIVESLKSIC